MKSAKARRKCERCRRPATYLGRYCRECEMWLRTRMLADGYLQPVPKEMVGEQQYATLLDEVRHLPFKA